MLRRRLTDRDDPRTALTLSVVILASGVVFALLGTGIPRVFLVVWLVVAAAQTVHALVRVHRSRREHVHDLADERPAEQEPPVW